LTNYKQTVSKSFLSIFYIEEAKRNKEEEQRVSKARERKTVRKPTKERRAL
jgi:hypothetical protein